MLRSLTAVLLLLAGLTGSAQAQGLQAAPFFQPFDDSRAAVMAELDQAKKSVHVAQYNIRDEAFALKLLALKARGIDVQLVIDAKNAANSWNTLDDSMEARGLPVHRRLHQGYAIMHHKFTVIDGATVITGSFNWNETARLSNDENMVVIRSRALATDYESEFQELLGAKPERAGSPAGLSRSDPLRVLFSPEDRPALELRNLIRSAKRRIQVAVFSFRDRDIARELAAAARRGIVVELITEFKQASKTGADETVARAGAKVIVAANRNAIHSAMHHKYAIFDGEIVVTGACNWTYTAFHKSDEDLLIVRDKTLAQSYGADFADLMARYDSGYLPGDYGLTRSIAAVHFMVEEPNTVWGEEVRVVGGHPALGNWDPAQGIRLGTSGSVFPRWSGVVRLPAGSRVEFKFVRVRADGSVTWEEGWNRIVEVDAEGRFRSYLESFRTPTPPPPPAASTTPGTP